MKKWVHKLWALWGSLQVELQGQYSLPRFHALRAYTAQTGLFRAVTVAVLAPLPCLSLVVAVDLMPLVSPGDGVTSQTVGFWIRTFLDGFVLTLMVVTELCDAVPALPMSTRRLWGISVAVGVILAVINYGYIQAIGFPVPFALQLGTGPWLLVGAMALWHAWRRVLRDDADTRTNLAKYLKVLHAKVVIIFVYTMFHLAFLSLRSGGISQTAFLLLLPPIKLFFKNWVSRGVLHLEDLAPTIVVFIVDAFHSLFVSLTMQQSVTGASLFVLIPVDFVQSAIAYYEIATCVRRMNKLAKRIEELQPTTACADARAAGTGTGTSTSTDWIRYAVDILQNNQHVAQHPDIANQRHVQGAQRRALLDSTRTNTGSMFGPIRIQPTIPSETGPSRFVPPSELQAWHPNVGGHGPSVHDRPHRRSSGKFDPVRVQPSGFLHASMASSPSVLQLAMVLPNNGTAPVHPVAAKDSRRCASLTISESAPRAELAHLHHQLVQTVLKLLHMVEFYVLVEYAEVIMATVYGMYIAVLSLLPNRIYYTQLRDLSQAQMQHAAGQVMVYALLELVSFVLFGLALDRKLRHFSVMRQLAFTLETHWRLVQANFVIVLFFIVQFSLEHNGTDYTFKFAWLVAAAG